MVRILFAMFYPMNNYYINPYGRVKIQSLKSSEQGLRPFILHKPTACGHPNALRRRVGDISRLARYARGDGTASPERHVNKPHPLSKCWREQRETFWIVIRLITFCSFHPKIEMIYYGKRRKRFNFTRQTSI